MRQMNSLEHYWVDFLDCTNEVLFCLLEKKNFQSIINSVVIIAICIGFGLDWRTVAKIKLLKY